jgi:hypothetical protein
MALSTSHQVPEKVLRAAHYTLYRAMVFCRNYSADAQAPLDTVYNLMDALHEIPQILSRWGTFDNDIGKLKMYFGLFRYDNCTYKVSDFPPPDLVKIFEDALNESAG